LYFRVLYFSKYFNNLIMKRFLKIIVIVFLAIGTIAIMQSCKKKSSPPMLTTENVLKATQTSAVSGGNVTNDGGSEVTARGVCWGTTQNPTISSSKTTDGTGTGAFTSNITGLTANAFYYIRAYATNNEGTSYGNEVAFNTNPVALATLTTTSVSSITTTSAISGGEISSDGGGTITTSGIFWSTSQNPTIADNKTTDGSVTGSFTSNLAALNPGTTYFVRAYAVNNAGVAYGIQLRFTTSIEQSIETQKADFPGGVRSIAASFSIGTKVYIGLGSNANDFWGSNAKDFWEWDQATNAWTRKADYPGNSSGAAVSFSIGTKGYIGTGAIYNTSDFTNEFWEYDPATNSWTQKASLPTTPGRASAVGFSIGTKGYIGIGGKPSTGAADFGGYIRFGAVGFSIGNKGYIGTGSSDQGNYTREFWEWDQTTNVWTKKSDFGGDARAGAVGFAIGEKGYIGTGYAGVPPGYKDFWEWNQATNTWTQKSNFGGIERVYAVGVSIGNRGYIGLGSLANDRPFYGYFKDFWEYIP
jgi:N-acetylneuraminic acid mutarotase